MVGLSLLVLRCRDLEKSRAFYEALGIVLVREQHASGPVHYAAVLEGGPVIELYPSTATHPPSHLRLGLSVLDVGESAEAVARLSSAPAAMRSSGHVIVVDPDGNTVEITERSRA